MAPFYGPGTERGQSPAMDGRVETWPGAIGSLLRFQELVFDCRDG
jgi:hypothetical protein